ncbi:peptidase domain-containing ABC transporter [Legionella sp. W05-934-2]|jgi:ATP-binding cassette subfamily B protein RaxB|uniref:peptidase domain-containing ABC transporter n=1 Tax=Legionella sp. W05-934-2 TaxID=1198649 RepID=UPI0034637BFE
MTTLARSLFTMNKQKLPVIKQVQFAECGHACVAMISNYHGHQIDLLSLRAIQSPSMNGTTMLDIAQLLVKLGFSTRAIQVNVDELKLVQCPAILHWNMNHFVVLKSVHQHHIIIHDPAVGERKVSWQEFSTAFTGIALEIDKADEFSTIHAQKKLKLIDLYKGIHGLKNSLLVLLMLSLAIEVFTLTNPLFIQYMTDNVAQMNGINNLVAVVAGFIILTLSHLLTEFSRSHFVVYLTNRMNEYFSSGVMHHLLKIPFTYFERRHKGDILSRFHAINEIQSKLTTESINTCLDGLVIIFSLMIMMIYSFKLTLIVMVALALYIALRIIAFKHHKTQTERSIVEHANVHSKFLEIIQNIMAIKLYAKEHTLFQSWKNYWIEAMNADIKISRVNILYNTANLFIFNMEHLLVMTVGAIMVIHHQFSVGMLMAYLAYRQNLVNKSSSLIQKIADFQLLSVQLERVADILMQPIEEDAASRFMDKPILGDLKLQHVSYRYHQNETRLLNDISLHIKPGEKVVLTGPSGVGKTTLLKIMLGLMPPCQGDIYLDDIPLKHVGISKYRSLCASVMQDDTLISGSILDNITFLAAKIDIEKVYQVAKIAQIHDNIIKMPMGYETLIGDMGSTLSGGQKQRILIARALYKDPKILFLDEATSHLDVETEIKINHALKQLNMTQISIAHRQESIKMADRIIEITH